MEANDEDVKSSLDNKGEEKCWDKCKCDIVVDNIRFWSTFDSGNLKSVSKDGFDEFFILQISSDCEYKYPELQPVSKHSGWFYFKVKSEKTTSV